MSVNITAKVDRVLKQYSPTCKYCVRLTHDGVDSDCYPKSFIYDLFVWEADKIFNYHFEDWFCPGDVETEFELYFSENEKDFFGGNIFSLRRRDFAQTKL